MPDRPRVVRLPADQGRPEPPADLTPAEADLWRNITGARPPNWINNVGAELTLAHYCRHVVICQDLARRALTDVRFIVKFSRQSSTVMRMAKELGLLPLKPRTRPPRPRLVRGSHSPTPPWSA